MDSFGRFLGGLLCRLGLIAVPPVDSSVNSYSNLPIPLDIYPSLSLSTHSLSSVVEKRHLPTACLNPLQSSPIPAFPTLSYLTSRFPILSIFVLSSLRIVQSQSMSRALNLLPQLLTSKRARQSALRYCFCQGHQVVFDCSFAARWAAA